MHERQFRRQAPGGEFDLLEQIGLFEGAGVVVGMSDFPLRIAHDLDEIGEGKTSAEVLKPEPFPVKTQDE